MPRLSPWIPRRCSRTAAALFVAAGLALSSGHPLRAQVSLLQEPPDQVQFAAQSWRSSDGLPQNTGCTVAQTRDGLVWIGTQGGLCRYDGRHMLVYDTGTATGLRSNRINCLHVAADGTLWIGTDQGGLARLVDGTITALPDLHEATITALGEDRHGRILAGAGGMLYRIDGERTQPVHPEIEGPVNTRRSKDGGLLVCASNGVWHIDDAVTADREATCIADCRATCAVEIDGHLVIGTLDGLRVLRDGVAQPWTPVSSLAQPVLAMLAASDGSLWVGTDTRATRIAPERFGAFTAPETKADARPLMQLQPTNEARSARFFFEDRDGGIWIGHTENGVSRLQRAEVLAHAGQDGLPPRGLTSVVGDADGNLFVGTNMGLLQRVGGRFVRIPETVSLGSCRGALMEADGTLWIGTSSGLARRPAGGPLTLWLDRTTPKASQIRAILRDGDHLWIGGDDGLFRLTGKQCDLPEFASELGDMSVRSLALAPDGAIWIGGSTRLCRIDPERTQVRTWHCGETMPFGELRCLLPENGPHAWIGSYGGGVVRIDDDRIRIVDKRHGLVDQSMCGLIRRPDHMLLATNSGLSMVTLADLQAVVDGRSCTVASRSLRAEGLREPECSGGMQSCATVIGDRIWWTGIQALYEYDPAAVNPRPLQPPIRVQELYVGENRWLGGADVQVPSDMRSITIELATCTFDDYAEVRFQWRLLGADEAWSEPSYQSSVRLPNLPPGELVFEARALGSDGSTSTVPARLSLHARSRLTETPAFWIAASLCLLFTVFGLMRLSVRRTARHARRLQALVAERTQELRTAQTDLELRVADRTHELEEALRRQQRDMEERQKLERQLQQLQRMESIGHLAGGIAHDFNNILTVAYGAGQMLEQEVSTPDGHDLCSNLRRACERGRGLTQHLLAVASRQLVQASRIDLGAVVAELLPVLRALLGEDVELRYAQPQGPLHVVAAVTQIEQILLNLAGNARDAMPRGGSLAIAMHPAEERVVMTICDSGVGMSPEIVERVFEPFFSTKGHGIGRGLGLATVYGITKQLGGEIRIESVQGQGTTVTLTLPTAAAAPEPAVILQAREPAKHLDATVLLIEDEGDVRFVMARMLHNLGCRVQAVENGDAALRQLRSDPDAVDIVLSDVVMPGLRGKDLVHALRAIRPGLPIVFASGYLDGRVTHADLAEMGHEILEKPVDAARLAAALHRLLDESARTRVG